MPSGAASAPQDGSRGLLEAGSGWLPCAPLSFFYFVLGGAPPGPLSPVSTAPPSAKPGCPLQLLMQWLIPGIPSLPSSPRILEMSEEHLQEQSHGNKHVSKGEGQLHFSLIPIHSKAFPLQLE